MLEITFWTIKSRWTGCRGRAQRLPPHCVPRKKHIGTSVDRYHKDKMNLEINDASAYEKKGVGVGSKRSRLQNKSEWGLRPPGTSLDGYQ